MKLKRYRIAWQVVGRARYRGHGTGYGSTLLTKPDAQDYCDALNQSHLDRIYHWPERVSLIRVFLHQVGRWWAWLQKPVPWYRHGEIFEGIDVPGVGRVMDQPMLERLAKDAEEVTGNTPTT